jgi:cobyrinic acid a,c-diamide synthase
VLGPRLIVAGVSSGVGKTTVATGLMAALRARGCRVAAAKVGPDFIDPGYHALATGRPPRNLDSWICGEAAMAGLAARAGSGSDILIVEGVMGLFDGAADGLPTASTASLAHLLGAPVLLVVDASAMSGSVAALVHGFSTFDPDIRIAGVVLNRVGSDGHEALLREALAPLGLPVVGALRRDDSMSWRNRHLGLIPVIEQPQEMRRSISQLGDRITSWLDLDAVLHIARGAPSMTCTEPRRARKVGNALVAVASGPAFDFVYRDNLEALADAGAELVPFDPRLDAALPNGVTGLYVGGGFPEMFMEDLSSNEDLQDDLREKAAAGLTMWAECGGLLWLSRSLDGHRLSGIIPTDGTMTERLTLGYRTAEIATDCPIGVRGTVLRGHEFHYSTVSPTGSALQLRSRYGEGPAGFATTHLLASYLHLHLGGDPTPAERFVATADVARQGCGQPSTGRAS